MLNLLSTLPGLVRDFATAVEAVAPHGLELQLDNIATKFGIDEKYILMQVISFTIMAFVLYWFAFKPVLATMDERNQKIQDGLKYAEEMKTKLAETEMRTTELLQQAQAEAQKILTEARQQAKTLYDNQVREAAAQVEDMLAKGRQASELERRQILAEVRREIAHLVVLTTGRVLQKTLTSEEKARLSEAAAREITSSN